MLGLNRSGGPAVSWFGIPLWIGSSSQIEILVFAFVVSRGWLGAAGGTRRVLPAYQSLVVEACLYVDGPFGNLGGVHGCRWLIDTEIDSVVSQSFSRVVLALLE
jgi:hypothetical protein